MGGDSAEAAGVEGGCARRARNARRGGAFAIMAPALSLCSDTLKRGPCMLGDGTVGWIGDLVRFEGF